MSGGLPEPRSSPMIRVRSNSAGGRRRDLQANSNSLPVKAAAPELRGTSRTKNAPPFLELCQNSDAWASTLQSPVASSSQRPDALSRPWSPAEYSPSSGLFPASRRFPSKPRAASRPPSSESLRAASSAVFVTARSVGDRLDALASQSTPAMRLSKVGSEPCLLAGQRERSHRHTTGQQRPAALRTDPFELGQLLSPPATPSGGGQRRRTTAMSWADRSNLRYMRPSSSQGDLKMLDVSPRSPMSIASTTPTGSRSPWGLTRGGRSGSGSGLISPAQSSDFLSSLGSSMGSSLGSTAANPPNSPKASPLPISSLLTKRAKVHAQLAPLTVETTVQDPRDRRRCRLPNACVAKREIRQMPENKKIFDLYHWDKVLQEEGDGGKVVLCKPKTGPDEQASDKEYVMKIKLKESLRTEGDNVQFRGAQTRMLNLPPHAGVLPYHEVLENDTFYYVVMERASGGPLFESLLTDFADGVMPGTAVKKVVREILEAVGHVHRQGMLHRDIKPDNLVMRVNYEDGNTTPVKTVALIDFDHADPDFSPKSPCSPSKDVYGTTSFNAPEMFLGMFSEQGDLYCVGVVLYMMMTGHLPYNDAVYRKDIDWPRPSWRKSVYGRMEKAQIDWTCTAWTEEPLCRQFCTALTAFNLDDRPSSVDEALAHAWFRS